MVYLFCAFLALPVVQEAKPAEPVRLGAFATEPKRVKLVQPAYPDKARRAGFAGIVAVELTIGTDGRVKAVQVQHGVPLLNEPVVAALKQWRYEPLLVNGVATPFTVPVAWNFGADPPPEAGVLIDLLKSEDPELKEYVALRVAQKAYRFKPGDKKKLAESLRGLLDSGQTERVVTAATKALEQLAR